MPHILSVSYDPLLLSTRQLMLESRGYRVTSVEGFVACMDACRSGTRYDLVILGHSIPHADKQAIVKEVKKYCNASILSLLRVGEVPVADADQSVDAMRPDILLECVDRILKHT